MARDPIATVEVTPDDRKRYRLIQQHGACRTQPSELFYANFVSPQARRTCHGCQVQGMCLDLALTYNEKGIWAGTSERERHRIRQAAVAS